MRNSIQVPVQRIFRGYGVGEVWMYSSDCVICNDFVREYMEVPEDVERATLYIIKDPRGNIEVSPIGTRSGAIKGWRWVGGRKWNPIYDGMLRIFEELCGFRGEPARVSVYMEYGEQ